MCGGGSPHPRPSAQSRPSQVRTSGGRGRVEALEHAWSCLSRAGPARPPSALPGSPIPMGDARAPPPLTSLMEPEQDDRWGVLVNSY